MRKKSTLLISIIFTLILISVIHSYHQQIHRIINRENSFLETIAYELASGNTKHAIKLLNEQGVDYCACVAFSETMIKMVGNKRYLWIHNAWHRIPKVDFMKYLELNTKYLFEQGEK